MNKELMEAREREMVQRSLAIWGRIVPELFTFEAWSDKDKVRYE